MTLKTQQSDGGHLSCRKTFAEIRIYSATISPREMEALLGLQPTRSATKGDVALRDGGRERITPFNSFVFSSEKLVSSQDLQHHIDWLLDKLKDRASALAALLAQGDVEASIDCVWRPAAATGGPILRCDQLAAIADLDLELLVDFGSIS